MGYSVKDGDLVKDGKVVIEGNKAEDINKKNQATANLKTSDAPMPEPRPGQPLYQYAKDKSSRQAGWISVSGQKDRN